MLEERKGEKNITCLIYERERENVVVRDNNAMY